MDAVVVTVLLVMKIEAPTAVAVTAAGHGSKLHDARFLLTHKINKKQTDISGDDTVFQQT